MFCCASAATPSGRAKTSPPKRSRTPYSIYRITIASTLARMDPLLLVKAGPIEERCDSWSDSHWARHARILRSVTSAPALLAVGQGLTARFCSFYCVPSSRGESPSRLPRRTCYHEHTPGISRERLSQHFSSLLRSVAPQRFSPANSLKSRIGSMRPVSARDQGTTTRSSPDSVSKVVGTASLSPTRARSLARVRRSPCA